MDKSDFQELNTDLNDPLFLEKVYDWVVNGKNQQNDYAVQVCGEEYRSLSKQLDETEVQQSVSVRNVLKTRRLARLVFDDEGKIDKTRLKYLMEVFESRLYPIGPERHLDAERQEHILKVLKLLDENDEYIRLIHQVGRPYSNPNGDELIRDTLQLSQKTPLTDLHARWSVLSAWLCYLRQSVGSCFATAPAIIIQKEQPKQLLKDLKELLNTGQIKRVFEGNEYTVPLSASWGSGDLKRRFLFDKKIENNATELWRSPGVLIALTRIGVLDEQAPLKEKIQRSKELFSEVLLNWNHPRDRFIASLEEILEKLLQKHLSITSEELKEHENQPPSMIQSGLMLVSSETSSKEKRFNEYYSLYDKAKKSFLMIADNALLKAWEFTIASYAESKADFTKWNLYSSLGMMPEDAGGIGPKVYEILKGKVDEYNKKMEDLQYDYDQSYGQLKYLETRMRQASTEQELKWVKIEYESRRSEFRAIEELRNQASKKAQRLANLYQELVEIYYEFFPEFFQEVYDPDMQEVETGFYDDSPAGFRLLCKYGRSATSAWVPIHSVNNFVDALGSFFVAVEHKLLHDERLAGLDDDLSEITTSIVTHIKTKEFLESAFHRMARAHNSPMIKNPLENLDKVEKKPWAYTSGGTMGTLISTYYKRGEKPTESSRWVENEAELLAFILDTIKKIPHEKSRAFEEQSDLSLLMHSPTHAFLLKPGTKMMKEGWNNNSLTYIFVRDHWIKERRGAVSRLLLDREVMRQLTEQIKDHVPATFHEQYESALSTFPKILSPGDFAQFIADVFSPRSKIPLLQMGYIKKDQIESVLYEALPFFPVYKLQERVEKILDHIPEIDEELKKKVVKLYKQFEPNRFKQESMSSKSLRRLIHGLILLAVKKTELRWNLHQRIAEACQKLEYALPEPIVFADTNWVSYRFGFVVSPTTKELELWIVEPGGTRGLPMKVWKKWVDGSSRENDWGIYTNKEEYIMR